MSDPNEDFAAEVRNNVSRMRSDDDLRASSRMWVRTVSPYNYAYNFSAYGRPIIQLPQDMIAIQEIIWRVRPDFVVETGVAHGGSLIHSAAQLALLDLCDATAEAASLDLSRPKRRVVGIDIDIRAHNRAEIERHPLGCRVDLVQGSSVDPFIVSQVLETIGENKRVLVILDSNHTHDHVLAELNAYAPLVSIGSYCIVYDTLIENLPSGSFHNRPWDKGNNPGTAVRSFLKEHNEFAADDELESKLLITVAPGGYLRRVR